MNQRYLSILAFLIVVSFFSVPTAYSADRYNLMRFYPNPDDGRFFHILDSRTLYQWQFTAGTVTSFAYRPLEEKDTGRKIVDKLWETHFFGTVGLTDWIEASLDVPLSLWDDFIDPDPLVQPASKWKINLGDIRLLVKGQILDRDRYPVGLSVAPFVTFPSGKEKYFLGDNSVTGGGDVIVDAQLGKYFMVALNAGAEGSESVQFRNFNRGKFIVRLGAGVSAQPIKNLSISAEVFVRSPTNNFFKDQLHTPAEVVGGVHYKIGNTGFIVYAGGGGGAISGAGAPKFRAFGGLTYKRMTGEFITRDEERAAMRAEKKIKEPEAVKHQMMIVDLKENCPPPEMFNPEIHDQACPKYYELREVADLIIRCPTNPEDYNPGVHDARCPKVYILKETMSESDINIAYAMSTVELSLRCPDTPEQYNPQLHDAACPKYYDLMEVVELISRCPENPEDFKPGVHDAGCPKVYELKESYLAENWVVVKKMSGKDVDRDKVPDILDRCPVERGEPTRMGCPAGAPVVTGDVLKTVQPIEFAFNSARIKEAMIPLLVEVADVMLRDSGMRLRVEGYTDVIGTTRANLRISTLRAEAVRDFMVNIGIDRGSLEAKGMGATNFVAPNETPEGRARNRRVIFVIIKR